MQDHKLRNLVKRHTNAQEKATDLFTEIVIELEDRGLVDEPDVMSCLNNTEPQSWAELVLQLINQDEKAEIENE